MAALPAPIVDADGPVSGTTRRALLGAGIGALVATVAAALGRPQPVKAANGDPVLAGANTEATLSTTISQSSPNSLNPTFAAVSSAGLGVNGVSDSGIGVEGQSTTSHGVRGLSDGRNGVQGRSNTDNGVYGFSNSGDGVHGYSGGRNGISGYTNSPGSDAGVLGESNHPSSFGITGRNLKTNALGVIAGENYGVVGRVPAGAAPNGLEFVALAGNGTPKGVGLLVQGRAKFSRSGTSLLPVGRSSVDVPAPGGLRSESLVLAVLMVNRPGVYVQAVSPNSATGLFRIYLNRVASTSSTTPIAWFIVN